MNPPRPPSLRRFTIADAMVLVAASAVGVLATKAYLPGFLSLQAARRFYFPHWAEFRHAWGWVTGPPQILVFHGMLALIALRLVRPRPSWRRLGRQPGFVACVAATASVAVGVLRWGVMAIAGRPGVARLGFEFAANLALVWTSTAVVGAWLALALTRRWRPEPSWVDRAGRVLGGYFVLHFVAAHIQYCWIPFLLKHWP